MKKIFKGILFIAGIILSLSVAAQTSDRDLIAQKLKIRYIPHPNTPPFEISRIPVSRVLNGFIFGSNSEDGMDNCAQLLRQLYQPSGDGGLGLTDLQELIANVIRITNDSVVVDIYNDVQPLSLYAKTNYLGNPGLRRDFVWPSAWRDDTGPGANGAIHRGNIRFGEKYATLYGLQEMKRTIVHEIMHTQDFSDVREHLWGTFRYGADGEHYGVELIPNMADAFGEGIANSMVYLYSGVSRRNILAWFNANDRCEVETTIPAGAAAHIPASQWLYTQVSSANPPGPGVVPTHPDVVGLPYREYRLAELPSRFLMHNEQIIGIIGAEYARKMGRQKYFQAIQSGNGQLFRVSTSAHARWFEALSRTAIPNGLSMRDITNASRTEMPYLFPLALADYFTYYQSEDKQQFSAMFENSLAQEWIDLYWAAGREVVRRRVPITMTGGVPPLLDASANIDAIATVLGVRTP